MRQIQEDWHFWMRFEWNWVTKLAWGEILMRWKMLVFDTPTSWTSLSTNFDEMFTWRTPEENCLLMTKIFFPTQFSNHLPRIHQIHTLKKLHNFSCLKSTPSSSTRSFLLEDKTYKSKIIATNLSHKYNKFNILLDSRLKFITSSINW